MASACQVIDLQKYRIARLIRQTSEWQSDLAGMLRQAAADRAVLAAKLGDAQRELERVAESYSVMLDRLDEERHFRDECLAATEIDDLDEMIRRRDELRDRLEHLRAAHARPALSDAK